MKINKQKVIDYFKRNKWWIGLVLCLVLLPFAIWFHKAWLVVAVYLPDAANLIDTVNDPYIIVSSGAMGFTFVYLLYILLGYYNDFARSLIAFFKHLFYKKHEEQG